MTGKKREPIRVEAYITIGGATRKLDDMSRAQKEYVGAMLRVNCLNSLFAGEANFRAVGLPKEETVFSSEKPGP